MAITAATVSSKVESAITAIEAGDWSTARSKLMAAKAALIALPDSERQSASMQWDRDAIDSLLDEVRKSSASGNSVQFTKIKHVREGLT